LASAEILNAESNTLKSTFVIPTFEINNKAGDDGWSYGAYFNKEKNERLEKAILELEDLSFQFERMGVYLGKKINEKLDLEIAANKRNDWALASNRSDFGIESNTNELKFNVNWIAKEWSDLNVNTTYRELNILNPSISRNDPNKSFFGRINYKLNILNQGLRSESLYETGSGQEPKQEYRYLMVQQGEGSYIWNDYNMDESQQVNEFEIAPFGDLGNFERFVVFNNEFIRTAKTEFRQIFDLRPSKFISKENDKFQWTKLLFWRTRYHLIKKTSGSNNRLSDSFNFSLLDSDIVSFGNNYDHTLYINQGSTVFNAEVGTRKNQNRIVLISGFEERQRSATFAKARTSVAENYEAKNFDIDFYSITPKMVVRINKTLRWSLAYSFGNQSNTQGVERNTTKDLGAELTWRRIQKSNLSANLNYVLNDFEGMKGSPVELDMLQGLTTGDNWVWSINYTQRIGKQIDANINYGGRKSGVNRTVHTFSGQMKILF